MQIESIDIEAYRAKLTQPMATSQGSTNERKGFLLRLRDKHGLCGWGEAAPIHWLEGNLERCEQALRSLSDAAGSTTEELRRRHATILAVEASAACALDTALCDIEARQSGTTLADWLAGLRVASSRIVSPRVAWSEIECPTVAALISQADPEALAEQARIRAGQGYRCLKIKVGADTITRDVERVAAVRAVFDGSLRLDANGAWNLEQAKAACAEFEGFNISYIEDPLSTPGRHSPAEACTQWRALAACTTVPLALDAGAEDAATRIQLIGESAISYVVLKLARTGGPSPALDIVRSLHATGVRAAFTDSIETGVGQRAVLHCAAAAQVVAHSSDGDNHGEHLDIGLGGAVMLGPVRGGKLPAQAPCDTLTGPAPKMSGPGLG